MNIQKRQARSARRIKANNLRRNQGVPFTASKFGWTSTSRWLPPMSMLPGVRMTHGSYQSWRKRARRDFRKTHGLAIMPLTKESA